jgi:hypothetical protein
MVTPEIYVARFVFVKSFFQRGNSTSFAKAISFDRPVSIIISSTRVEGAGGGGGDTEVGKPSPGLGKSLANP